MSGHKVKAAAELQKFITQLKDLAAYQQKFMEGVIKQAQAKGK